MLVFLLQVAENFDQRVSRVIPQCVFMVGHRSFFLFFSASIASAKV